MKVNLQPIPDRSRWGQMVRYLITIVWLVNGLWCKLLDMVPRHEQIAAGVLGLESATGLIQLIGAGELLMAGWVFSRILPRLNGWIQIGIVAVMNVLECFRAPDLLLYGRGNALVALAFMVAVYFHSCRQTHA